MCALVYMSCIFFLHFFAQSLPMLLAAQILVGVPWGSEFSSGRTLNLTLMTSLPNTHHELCRRRRACGASSVSLYHHSSSCMQSLNCSYLTTWVNACWGIGQLLALAVLRGLLPRQDDWGWRIPYALQVSLLARSLTLLADSAVDVACSFVPGRILRTRVPLVASQERAIRRCQAIIAQADQQKR